MFAGIVAEVGKVASKKKISEGFKFKVRSKKVIRNIKVADSVCINGICHTVTGRTKNEFEFVTMHETLKKTNLGKAEVGDPVNLENSLRMNEQIGGHFVAGHIDDTGIITKVIIVNPEDVKSKNWDYWVKVDKKHFKYVIYVGSISINGVSLTVAEVKKPKGKFFELKVAIIPFTYDNTTFGILKKGDRVNLEFDFLGKYVVNALKSKKW